ncbi:MAG: DUF2807 domain-containing protein [Alistipes sp.]|nr:DUF2807 domain-containing protein [Alistipes sp.]
MRRLFITLLSLLAVGAAVADNSDNNLVMKAVKSNMEFSSISAGPLVKIFIEERTEGNIIIRAPKDIIEFVELKVEDGELCVGYKRDTEISFNGKNRSTEQVAEIYIPNNGKLCEFEVAACSTIDVKPAIKANKIDIDCVGVASINLKGTAEKVDIAVRGASNIDVDIVCTELDCEVLGASKARISGSATKAEFEILGASTLRASELKTSQLEADISGASTADICSESADIEASGASNANIECTTKLTASASGASTIRYSGDCSVNITRNSGASTIRKK